MTLLAEREHARTDLVAASHSLRLVIVTVSIPFALQWLGRSTARPDAGRHPHRATLGLALLAGLTLCGWR
jgi:uncharacterized membrane protein AbrB (regulator of aidB expression)